MCEQTKIKVGKVIFSPIYSSFSMRENNALYYVLECNHHSWQAMNKTKNSSNLENICTPDYFPILQYLYGPYHKYHFFTQHPTVLAKILGVYRIGYRNNHTNTALKQDVLVMENLFYGRKISQVRTM